MIKYQFSKRSTRGITNEIRDIIEKQEKDKDKQITSNEMLAIVCPYIEKLGFSIESSKFKNEKTFVPVLFRENDEVDKSFAVGVTSTDGRIVIEVEAGRAVFNNQYLRDIFYACMMFQEEYLVMAVLNECLFKVNGNEYISPDFTTLNPFLYI